MGKDSTLAQKLITGQEGQLRERILKLLTDEQNIEYRDNDYALQAHVWYEEYGEQKCGATSAFDFLQLYAQRENGLSKPETIVDIKRKLQDQYDYLRGEKYEPYEQARTTNTKHNRRNKKRLDKNDNRADTAQDSDGAT